MPTKQERAADALLAGQIICGKHNGLRYKIQSRLKTTINESTYICQFKSQVVKLVISENKTHIMQEMRTLKLLNDIDGFSLSPLLIDVDHYIARDQRQYYFYVTEYIQGKPLFHLSQRLEWVYLITLQLLEQFDYLHGKNMISGKLVADQLVLDRKRSTVYYQTIIHPIKIGCPVRSSASIYDRSYWGLGSRLAEPSYDLFSLVIFILHDVFLKTLHHTDDPVGQLILKINKLPIAKGFKQCLIKAIFGKYPSSAAMKKDILNTLTQKKKRALRRSGLAIQRNYPSLLEINCLVVVALFSFGLSFCLI